LDKAWARHWDITEECIPTGSSANPGILLQSALPTMPFEFLFDMTVQSYGDFSVDDGLSQLSLMYCVSKVVGLPRVCRLAHCTNMVLKVLQAATHYDDFDIWSLIDAG
jgi:hypothetical protein